MADRNHSYVRRAISSESRGRSGVVLLVVRSRRVPELELRPVDLRVRLGIRVARLTRGGNEQRDPTGRWTEEISRRTE
jgi:hypothetical protein